MSFTAIAQRLLKVRPRRGGGYASYFAGDMSAVESLAQDILAVSGMTSRAAVMAARETAIDVLTASGLVASGPVLFIPFRSANFEYGTTGTSAISSTDGLDTDNGAQTPTIDTSLSFSGTRSAKVTIAQGANFMGGWKTIASSTSGGVVAAGHEVWVRERVFIPSSWTITTGDGGMKFFRWRFYGSGGVPAGSNTIQLWGAGPSPSGIRTECEGLTPDTRLFVPTGGWNDRWITFEYYIKLARAGSGILRTWVDGVLRGEVLGVDVMGTNSFVNLAMLFRDYFNNTAPKTQSLWMDNIEIYGSWDAGYTPQNLDAAGNRYVGM